MRPPELLGCSVNLNLDLGPSPKRSFCRPKALNLGIFRPKALNLGMSSPKGQKTSGTRRLAIPMSFTGGHEG